MKITITCELNARNLELLKQLCDDAPTTIPGHVLNPIAVPESILDPIPAETLEKIKEDLTAESTVSLQDVKAVCLKMSKAGRQAELKTAFAKFGGKKLSDIAEADYPALLKELGDA